jgi:hypothetical protein
MGLQQRGRCRFFVRSTRVNGRIVSQYLGSGVAADLAAADHARERQEQETEKAARRQAQARHASAIAPLDELCDLTDLLLKATLVSAGYHRHQRGAWRLRRVNDGRGGESEEVLSRPTQGHPGEGGAG